MAIAIDSQNKSTAASAAFNNAAGNLLIVFSYVSGGSTSGVTYNGVSMTQVQTESSGAGRQSLSAWILKSPATGSNTLAVTNSGTFTEWFALSYSGCDTAGTQPDSSHLDTGSGTGPLTGTTTVVASNCWLVIGSADSQGGETAGTGTTLRQTDTGNGIVSGDSNATVGTGSQSLNVNYSGSATSWGAITMSIAPATGGGGTTNRPNNLLTLGVS